MLSAGAQRGASGNYTSCYDLRYGIQRFSSDIKPRITTASKRHRRTGDVYRTLALIVNILVGNPMSVWASLSVLMMTDLPPPVGPITIVVCRVFMISYIWITFSVCSGDGHSSSQQSDRVTEQNSRTSRYHNRLCHREYIIAYNVRDRNVS